MSEKIKAAEALQYRFPGLFSFEDNDLSSQLFCGREEEGYKLLQYILSELVTVLHGTSGNGKTSILQAYVFRKLRDYSYYPVMVRLNVKDKSPQDIIKARFREVAKQPGFEWDEISNENPDGADYSDLKEFFGSAEIWTDDIRLLTPVIVFDQFEEIFTLEHNNAYRNSFFEELAALINACREGILNCKIVLSIRGDMLNRLDNIAHLIPSILSNRFSLKPLSLASAKRAITEPAKKILTGTGGAVFTRPFLFTEDAKEDLLNFLCLKKVSGNSNPGEKMSDDSWKPSDEVSPIQLQIICRELEEKAKVKAKEIPGNEMIEITCKDLKGEDKTVKAGLQHILGGFYDKQLAKLQTELGLETSEILSIRNVIETDLISGTRRVPVDYYALIGWSNIRQDAIDLLIANRLLKSEERGDNTLVEISHDTLIEPILESYETRKKEEANNLYERLMRKVTNTFDLRTEERKALQTLIEQRLVADEKRTTLDYSYVIEQPNIREKAIKYLIKENLLNKTPANFLEISNDIYVDQIVNQFKLRKVEEEKAVVEKERSVAENEKAVTERKLTAEKEKIAENRKRIKRNVLITSVVLLSVTIACAAIYVMNLESKNNIINQMAMLFKGNEYLEKGDLKKAFGIYGNLRNKGESIIVKQLDSLKFDYTDIPGSTVRALSNNHILSLLNDSTFQIWKIISADSIHLDTTFTNVKSVAYSLDDSYFAIYADKKLILYNSRKDINEEFVLLNNTELTQEPYFAFSKYDNYFSYFSNNRSHTISLIDGNEINYKWDERFQSLFKSIIYSSGSVFYTYYDNYIYGWKNNRKDSFVIDPELSVNMEGVSWIPIEKDTLIYISSEGLKFYILLDKKSTIAQAGKFLENEYIEKPSDNIIFTYSDKYFKNEKREKDYNLIFYNLEEKRLHKPFGTDTIEHLSVNSDYTKCLVGVRNKEVYLVNNITAGKTKLPFLEDAAAYDISDDGNTILFVKKKKIPATKTSGEKKVSYLYSYTLADTFSKTLPRFIDTIYENKNSEDSNTIYAKYYFRFSSDSKLFAYTKQRNDSTFFTVRNLTDFKTIFSSYKIKKSISEGYRKDFLSNYVHIQNKDGKEGIVLLNGRKRDVAYYSKLYPPMTDPEYQEEVSKLHLDL